MPVLRTCPHCFKKMLCSTYQMMNHIDKDCKKAKSVIVHVSKKNIKNKLLIQPLNQTNLIGKKK